MVGIFRVKHDTIAIDDFFSFAGQTKMLFLRSFFFPLDLLLSRQLIRQTTDHYANV